MVAINRYWIFIFIFLLQIINWSCLKGLNPRSQTYNIKDSFGTGITGKVTFEESGSDSENTRIIVSLSGLPNGLFSVEIGGGNLSYLTGIIFSGSFNSKNHSANFENTVNFRFSGLIKSDMYFKVYDSSVKLIAGDEIGLPSAYKNYFIPDNLSTGYTANVIFNENASFPGVCFVVVKLIGDTKNKKYSFQLNNGSFPNYGDLIRNFHDVNGQDSIAESTIDVFISYQELCERDAVLIVRNALDSTEVLLAGEVGL